VTLTIGKVASLFKVTADTLRYYEREGLISPTAKSSGGYRLYDDKAVRRVRFIKQAQHCGFTLTEIRDLLTLRGSNRARCRDIRRVALEKKLELEAKVKAMRSISKALDRLIAACGDGSRRVGDCPIVAALEKGQLR